jgi:hypothetical protein
LTSDEKRHGDDQTFHARRRSHIATRNLKLSFEQRAQEHLRALQMVEELRRAGKKLKQKSDDR